MYDVWLFSEVMHLRYFDEKIDLIASFMPIGSLALLNDRCEKIFVFLRKLQLVVTPVSYDASVFSLEKFFHLFLAMSTAICNYLTFFLRFSSNDVTFCLRFVFYGRDLVLFCVVFSKLF